MYNLYKNIEILCDGKGENITQMCKIAGVPRGNLTDLKMGRQNGLSSKNLHKIAEHFGVTVEFLLTGENKKSPTSEDVELYKSGYYSLTEDNKAIIDDLIAKLLKSQSAE